MSDLDLRTKWRPKTFEEVVGQEALVRSLTASLKAKNCHCYLLSGSAGTGKSTIARLIAKEVGCKPNNYTEINAADVTGVDAMRALIETSIYSGIGGGSKVIVLDEIHRLSASAFSVLLKPTEDTPKHVYWVFCTTDPGKIPKANLTRCTQYETKPVDSETMCDWLTNIAKQEKFTTSEEVLYLLAQKADGSPRQALVNLIKCHGCKTRKFAAKMLKEIDVEGDGAAVDLCRLLMKGTDWKGAMAVVKAIAEKDNNR
jgi:DNA polymerase-3 subunit gamma/tau